MALTNIARIRIVLDLIKNGNVTTESNYDSPGIDYLNAPTALKYADAMIEHYDEIPAATVASMGNAEKSKRVINILKRYVRQALILTRKRTDGVAAEVAAESAANSEADSEIGTEE